MSESGNVVVNRGSSGNYLPCSRDRVSIAKKMSMGSYRWASSFSLGTKLTSDNWRERDFMFALSRAWEWMRGGSFRFINDKCLERDLVFVSPGGRSTSAFDLVWLVGVGVKFSSCSIFPARAPGSLVSMSSVASSRMA